LGAVKDVFLFADDIWQRQEKVTWKKKSYPGKKEECIIWGHTTKRNALMLHSHPKRVDSMRSRFTDTNGCDCRTFLWDVLNKYKAELVVISSIVDGGNDSCFHGVKPQR